VVVVYSVKKRVYLLNVKSVVVINRPDFKRRTPPEKKLEGRNGSRFSGIESPDCPDPTGCG
jgi:hypothetical protein